MKERNSTPRYLIIKALVCACVFSYPSFCLAQGAGVTYEELRQKYLPQDSPEATYRLELEMMSGGIYCYDLPIFDRQWRSKGSSILYSSAYKTAKRWDTDSKTRIEGEYAVIYYPQDKSLGPVFLYRDASGWVLDRTCVMENIHYATDNSRWFAYEASYPYLGILKNVFNLQKIRLNNGAEAYQVE